MSVGIVGSGPAVVAIEAALTDVGVEATSLSVDRLPDVDLAAVVGRAGDGVFERANEQALATGGRWLAVELGGVGGVPLTEAAVTGMGPDTGCYACLCGRVVANADPDADPSGAPPDHAARFAGAVAGRLLARHLADGADVFGQVVEIPEARREVLPLPHCACSDTPTRRPDRTHADRDLDAALASAERALDDRVGIVADVGEAESFPLPYYLARGCDTSGFSDATAARDAAGVAADWDRAFMKALGEALERYCAGVYRRSEFETGTADAVDDALSPAAFATAEAPDRGEELAWVRGEELATGRGVALPAEFVHYPPPSRTHVAPVTTGLGLGNGGIEALLAGLYEVIERDAAMLAWYSTFDPLGLAVDDPAVETLRARARSENLSVSTLLVTQDVDVPVVAAALTREEWPRLAFGLGAHLDPARAARSALSEAVQNWMELRRMGPEDAADAPGEIGRYARRPGEATSFLSPDGALPASSVGPGTVPEGKRHLEALLDRLDEAELTAYAARTTTRDVERLGFEAVRVLVPRAQPLFFGERAFGERAESVPRDLGFEPTLDRAHHPFP